MAKALPSTRVDRGGRQQVPLDAGNEWSHEIDPATARRAVRDYLANLDEPAWGAATDVVPKFVAPADPAAQWTGALRNAAFFAYADNYLIDVKFGIIMDVEASRAIRQAEVGASQTMIERTEATFGLKPDWLVADTAYGSAPNLHFLVDKKDIAPHIPVIDKSKRDDGTFSREDFIYDEARDCYICRNGKILPRSSGARGSRGDDMISYFSRVADCRACPLKSKCCPNSPSRKITRHIHEAARDVARAIAKTAGLRPDAARSQKGRDAIRSLEAHPSDGTTEAEGAGRCPVRVYARSNRPEPPPPRNIDGTPAGRSRAALCVASGCVGGVGVGASCRRSPCWAGAPGTRLSRSSAGQCPGRRRILQQNRPGADTGKLGDDVRSLKSARRQRLSAPTSAPDPERTSTDSGHLPIRFRT